MNNKNNSIIDMLYSTDQLELDDIDKQIYIPTKCSKCHNSMICNILPTSIGFFRMGIKISIEDCTFFKELK